MRTVPLAAACMSDLTRRTMQGALAGHPNLDPTPMSALRDWHDGEPSVSEMDAS